MRGDTGIRGGTGMRGGIGRTVMVAACATVGVLLPPAPASGTIKDCERIAPHPRVTPLSYTQQRYDANRLAPLATGAGITVAVIDSGVDDDHPQLRGGVDEGRDLLGGRADGRQDCNGHGTGVAGIIAARPADGTEFRGLACHARILPIRVTERGEGDPPSDDVQNDVDRFARAIDWAVEQRADVINLSLTLDRDDESVRTAIARAVRQDIVVVAAVGNSAAAAKGNPTPYPAAYPGVLGVGATGPDGTKAEYSQYGPYVDVVAPGEAILMPAPGGGHRTAGGTSFAAPFVAATAALIMQRFPELDGQEVVKQITATADPAPGGRHSDEYGWGIVNPYRALTETVLPAGTGIRRAVPLPTEDPAVAAVRAQRDRAATTALWLAATSAGITVVVVLIVVVVPNGRRRRWSPAGRS